MEHYIEQLDEFFDSNCKIALVYGTNIHYKITKLSKYVFERFDNTTFLIRTNGIGKIEYWTVPEELRKPKKKTANKKYVADGNIFYFDSLSSKANWNKTRESIDIAIVYPADCIKDQDKEEFLDSLKNIKDIKKIILVSWNDSDGKIDKFFCGSECYPIAIDGNDE